LEAEEAEDAAFQRRLLQPRPAYTGTMAEGAGLRRAIREIEETGPPVMEQEPAMPTTSND
jgi:hypothetical protein